MSQWSNWEADEMIKEAEAHWEDPNIEPSDRDIEEELAAQSEWQMYLWITDDTRWKWSSWEVL